MSPEPIDEAHVTRLFAKSERAEHKQPILRSTRPRWLRLTVGEQERILNQRKRWLRKAWFISLLVFAALGLYLTAIARKRPVRSTEPEKPAERVLDPSAAPREGVWRDGRLQSYAF